MTVVNEHHPFGFGPIFNPLEIILNCDLFIFLSSYDASQNW